MRLAGYYYLSKKGCRHAKKDSSLPGKAAGILHGISSCRAGIISDSA